MSAFADFLRKNRRGFCSMVVVAAGASERMGEDKLFLELDGVPVLARTLTALNESEAVDELIVVTRESAFDSVAALRERCNISKLTKMVPGGATRTESALCGVRAASPKAKLIGVHDGARPFVTPEIISKTVDLAAIYGAAAPAVPVHDTVKAAANGAVLSTPPRDTLHAIQTPQVFRAEIIKAALTKAVQTGTSYTDDCAAAEAIGAPAHLSAGDADNIKLTTPLDLELARAILEKRGGGAA